MLDVGETMAQDVPDEAETDSAAGAAGQHDRNQMVVDVVSLKMFLAVLKDAIPPKERPLALVRSPPTRSE
jgi:hypothetical protein